MNNTSRGISNNNYIIIGPSERQSKLHIMLMSLPVLGLFTGRTALGRSFGVSGVRSWSI